MADPTPAAVPSDPTPPTEPAAVDPVHTWFLLDRSGSMSSLHGAVVDGFNEFLSGQKAKAGAALRLTVVQFDDQDPYEVVVGPVERERAGGGGHHDVLEALLVAAVHALEEGTEGSLAHLTAALIDIVRHILGQQREKGLAVTAVKSFVVFLDQEGRGHSWAEHARRGCGGGAGRQMRAWGRIRCRWRRLLRSF